MDMEKEIQKLLDAVADLRHKANANACFGEPVLVEDCVVIPVASVSYGFGAGIGQCPRMEDMGMRKAPDTEEPKVTEQEENDIDSGKGGGGGGGASARPIAALEVTSKGVRVEPVMDEQKLALAGALLIGWNVFWLARALIKIFGQQD